MMMHKMMKIDIKLIIESLLVSAEQPVTMQQLLQAFDESAGVTSACIIEGITALKTDYTSRSFEINESTSGFFLQTKAHYAPWINRFNTQKPVKYSKALLETLAIIAYRQPVTRADIEALRGVVASGNMMKTLLEREWVKVAGYRDVPGKPAEYVTTETFLMYFNLKSLDDLPVIFHPVV